MLSGWVLLNINQFTCCQTHGELQEAQTAYSFQLLLLLNNCSNPSSLKQQQSFICSQIYSLRKAGQLRAPPVHTVPIGCARASRFHFQPGPLTWLAGWCWPLPFHRGTSSSSIAGLPWPVSKENWVEVHGLAMILVSEVTLRLFCQTSLAERLQSSANFREGTWVLPLKALVKRF